MNYTKDELKKMLKEAENREQEKLRDLLFEVSEAGITNKAISEMSSVSTTAISNFKNGKTRLSEDSISVIVDSIKQLRDKLNAAIEKYENGQ